MTKYKLKILCVYQWLKVKFGLYCNWTNRIPLQWRWELFYKNHPWHESNIDNKTIIENSYMVSLKVPSQGKNPVKK